MNTRRGQSIPIRVVHRALRLLEIIVTCTGGRVLSYSCYGQSIPIRVVHKAIRLLEIIVACPGGRIILYTCRS